MAQEFIQIEVITTGDDLDERFNTDLPAKVIFNRSLQLVGGTSDRGQWQLEWEGQVLDLEMSLDALQNQYGWGDEVVLDLVPVPEVI